ncbi:ARMT1-like domain-containing protein [Nocardia sp. NBC_01730]|uniref:hypothetical protein n=1 Tax=Nocardia sp. NBC_01730 TaxID=2975998 RepID=UPI002E120EDD|nr:ARMT1-like domain-containing protein [Nocardia sp. NBC_01730]
MADGLRPPDLGHLRDEGTTILKPPTPPLILASVPGSFAHGVFHQRHPKLVQRVLDALPNGPTERAAIHQLLIESTAGVMEPLKEDTPTTTSGTNGATASTAASGGEAPFLWAESFFYRKLLEATGYFRPGAWHGLALADVHDRDREHPLQEQPSCSSTTPLISRADRSRCINFGTPNGSNRT